MPNIFRTGRLMNFKLHTQTEHEDPLQRQALWPSRSNVKVARSRDASDRCWTISRERNVLETPKLVGKLSTPLAIMRTSSRSKVKFTTPTNAEIGSASYLPKGKAYELQTWYTDWARRPALPISPTSAMTSEVKVSVVRSRGPSDWCWPISQ